MRLRSCWWDVIVGGRLRKEQIVMCVIPTFIAWNWAKYHTACVHSILPKVIQNDYGMWRKLSNIKHSDKYNSKYLLVTSSSVLLYVYNWLYYVGFIFYLRVTIYGICNTKVKFLSKNRTQSRVVTGLLTGHNTLRRHLYLLGLLDSPLCRGCGVKEETSAYIRCECESLAWLRRVSGFLFSVTGVY